MSVRYKGKKIASNDFVNKLSELTGDVSISSPSAGQSLQYDGYTKKWKNATSSSSIGFDGITGSPEDNAALKNALDEKADISSLKTVATSGNYDDLTNKYVITYDSPNTRLVIAKP